MTLDVSLEPFENSLTEDPVADEDFADLSEIDFWMGAPLWAVVVWRRVDLEGKLRLTFPELEPLALEALADASFPIEYAFVFKLEDVW